MGCGWWTYDSGSLPGLDIFRVCAFVLSMSYVILVVVHSPINMGFHALKILTRDNAAYTVLVNTTYFFIILSRDPRVYGYRVIGVNLSASGRNLWHHNI